MNRVLNDRYELRQHAARGGMADVYHAWDQRLSRDTAVKVLRPELSAEHFRAPQRQLRLFD